MGETKIEEKAEKTEKTEISEISEELEAIVSLNEVEQVEQADEFASYGELLYRISLWSDFAHLTGVKFNPFNEENDEFTETAYKCFYKAFELLLATAELNKEIIESDIYFADNKSGKAIVKAEDFLEVLDKIFDIKDFTKRRELFKKLFNILCCLKTKDTEK